MSQRKVLLDHLNSGNLETDELYRRYYFSAISMLAYRQPDKCETYWDDLGYKSIFFDQDGAQCYLLEHDDHFVVAFRGTEPKEISDIKADLSILKTWHRGHGKVHRGFMIEVWKLADDLATHIYQTEKQVYVCGHSLGGAMATLYGTLCRPKGSPVLYTYGSPRCGNTEYHKHFDIKHVRVQNNNDAVPSIPPRLMGFKHVGENIYINHYGNIRHLTAWQKFKDKYRGYRSAITNLEFFDSIRDHSIDKYCYALYNDWYYQDKKLFRYPENRKNFNATNS